MATVLTNLTSESPLFCNDAPTFKSKSAYMLVFHVSSQQCTREFTQATVPNVGVIPGRTIVKDKANNDEEDSEDSDSDNDTAELLRDLENQAGTSERKDVNCRCHKRLRIMQKLPPLTLISTW
ncbi:uncharacterized protein ARMOST_15822 [Armillaria ostoyae]|uniref:Uncharacterized protein n=1 Tax=Armillaria ostoyae TaxID=47428 RepID=A0A284RUL2_ARMOS|nr:uncharacterized protein ARMOST_15822 [Armillaria ostoyae]